MPTGYTIGISDGTITSTKDYISQCARAFGATIMMRDEPMNAPIPETFEPSTYSRDALEKAKTTLVQMQNMNDEEIQSKIEEEYKSTVEKNKKYRIEKNDEKNRYVSMLAKVHEWQPPTPDHINLKEFCINQINESMKWGFSNLDKYYPEAHVKQTIEQWREDNLKSCLRDIEYHSKQWNEEIKRTNERNLWIKQLRDSLNGIE